MDKSLGKVSFSQFLLMKCGGGMLLTQLRGMPEIYDNMFLTLGV